MRLLSYLSKGQVRTARQVGDLGLDFKFSAELYRDNHAQVEMLFDVIPISFFEFLLLGSEGMQFSNDVTDWVLSTFPVSQLKALKKEVAFNIKDVILTAPIPTPGKVICIAGNYPIVNQLDKPEYPTVFLKPSSGVIGNQQAIILPELAEGVACEVELAVVIGKRGRNLTQQESLSIIAGYTIANDLGDRLLEKRTSQWTSGKMFDTFTPMGPIMITTDELSNTSNLELFTNINDRVVQKGNTAQMFFNVPQLISYLSTITTLNPGDVVLTGSPKLIEGKPNPLVSLRAGDFVHTGIEKIGTLINPVISEIEIV